MHGHPPLSRHPVLDFLVFVDSQIVHDHVQLLARILAVEQLQKLEEFLMVRALYAPPLDSPCVDRQGGQETGRAVAFVGVVSENGKNRTLSRLQRS